MAELDIEYIREIHNELNPHVDFNTFLYNYGWNMQAIHGTFNVKEGTKIKYRFTEAKPYQDIRKPNEIQTTD